MNNTRPATCRLCTHPLLPGQAELWHHQEPAGPGYYCNRCIKVARAYRNQVKRSSQSLADLRRWIADHVPAAPVAQFVPTLGSVQYVDQAVICQAVLNATMKAMDLAGPFLPAPLLSYLDAFVRTRKEELTLDVFTRIVETVSDAVLNHLYSLPNFPRTSTHEHERLNQSPQNNI